MSPVSPVSRGRRSPRASRSTLWRGKQELEGTEPSRVFLVVSLVSVRSADSGGSPGGCGAADPVGPPSASVLQTSDAILHVEANPRFLETGVCVCPPFFFHDGESHKRNDGNVNELLGSG